MDDIVNKPLMLRKKSKKKRFSSWGGPGNHFFDKIFRGFYIFLLFAINFVMFVYAINGRLMEDGVYNQAIIQILGGFGVFSIVLMLLFSFSKIAQNVICAVFTMIFVVLFMHQFGVFDINNFIEPWLEKKAGWLTFICFIPSTWLTGLLFGGIIYLMFNWSLGVLFFAVVLCFGLISGIKKNEDIKSANKEYVVVKELGANVGQKRDNNIIYFMIPKFPSYQFLSGIEDTGFRDLRNLILGFFSVNGFEVYSNAFVESDDTNQNIIDILNQVDYTSATSGNRGYAEFINDWNFIHGGIDSLGLEENKLYDYLAKEGYGVTIYPVHNFNICMAKNEYKADRCVVKGYKTLSLYDKKASLDKNVNTLLAEFLINTNRKDLSSYAKSLARKSTIKGHRVTVENRRVSMDGAPKIFDDLAEKYMKDSNGQVYLVYVDLPSDIYMYDEYCNVKPKTEWVALKNNSLANVGIDEKRKAYVDQAKCLIGKMQEFVNVIKESDKFQKTDIIVQGVGPFRELGGMTGGRYNNFVTDKLVSLGIRKGNDPRFLINANVCLASDFTKSLITGKEYCYSIDNMKMPESEAINLKKNLINNSVIRGGKITTIAINYRDWYEIFKKNSLDYQGKLQKVIDDENQRKATFERKEAKDIKNDNNKVLEENIFDLSGDVNALGLELDELGLPKDDSNKSKVEELKKEVKKADEKVEAKVEELKKEVKKADEKVEAKVEELETKKEDVLDKTKEAEEKAIDKLQVLDAKLKEIRENSEANKKDADFLVNETKETIESKANEIIDSVKEVETKIDEKVEVKKDKVDVKIPDVGAISLDI